MFWGLAQRRRSIATPPFPDGSDEIGSLNGRISNPGSLRLLLSWIDIGIFPSILTLRTWGQGVGKGVEEYDRTQVLFCRFKWACLLRSYEDRWIWALWQSDMDTLTENADSEVWDRWFPAFEILRVLPHSKTSGVKTLPQNTKSAAPG